MVEVIEGCDAIEKIGKKWYITNKERGVHVTVNTYNGG